MFAGTSALRRAKAHHFERANALPIVEKYSAAAPRAADSPILGQPRPVTRGERAEVCDRKAVAGLTFDLARYVAAQVTLDFSSQQHPVSPT